MKNLKKQRRIQVIAVAAVALIVATALIGYALQDGINYFRSPSQVAEAPPKPSEVFRIGGLVADGSLQRGQGETVRFAVTDGGAYGAGGLYRRSAGSVSRRTRAWSAPAAT